MSLWKTPEKVPAGPAGTLPAEGARDGLRAPNGHPAEEAVNPQVSGPAGCPSCNAGTLRAPSAAGCPSCPPPYQGARGRAQGYGQRPNWQKELGRERARGIRGMACPACGWLVHVGPDDEVGGYHEVVATDPHRLTQRGMYEAATSGRRLFTVHHGKYGPYLNWLGDYATPDPNAVHLVAAHDCNLDPPDHHPPPPPAGADDAPPF